MIVTIKKTAGYALLAAIVAYMGIWVENSHYLTLATFIGINTLLAVGLNMLMGYAGQISLGHAAFFGLGAYTTGVLTVNLGWSPWLTLPCSLAVAVVVAVIVGLPTLKLTGYYLAMGTLGFGMIAHIVFREWSGLTGGASGLVGIPALKIGPVTLTSGRNGMYLIWGMVIATFFVCGRIVNSRVGRALRAIHFSEQAAAAVGVNIARAKLQIFVFSAVLAALAGFFYAHMIMFVSPSTFGFLASVRFVTMVVIGGMASIFGSLFGAGLLTLLPEVLHVFSDYEMVVYGLVLMIVMIFVPQGLFRGVMDLYERSRSGRRGPTPPGSGSGE